METHFKTPKMNQSGSDSELQLVFKEEKKINPPLAAARKLYLRMTHHVEILRFNELNCWKEKMVGVKVGVRICVRMDAQAGMSVFLHGV